MDFSDHKKYLVENALPPSQDYGEWKVVAEDEHSDDAYVCLQNKDLQIRIVRDRGQEFVDLGPSQRSAVLDESLLFPFDLACAVADGEIGIRAYLEAVESRWSGNLTDEVEYVDEVGDIIEIIGERRDEFAALFQGDSLMRITEVLGHAKDAIAKILQENEPYLSQNINPDFLDSRMATLVGKLKPSELKEVIAVFPVNTQENEAAAKLVRKASKSIDKGRFD